MACVRKRMEQCTGPECNICELLPYNTSSARGWVTKETSDTPPHCPVPTRHAALEHVLPLDLYEKETRLRGRTMGNLQYLYFRTPDERFCRCRSSDPRSTCHHAAVCHDTYE